jgi:hypothetical protein
MASSPAPSQWQDYTSPSKAFAVDAAAGRTGGMLGGHISADTRVSAVFHPCALTCDRRCADQGSSARCPAAAHSSTQTPLPPAHTAAVAEVPVDVSCNNHTGPPTSGPDLALAAAAAATGGSGDERHETSKMETSKRVRACADEDGGAAMNSDPLDGSPKKRKSNQMLSPLASPCPPPPPLLPPPPVPDTCGVSPMLSSPLHSSSSPSPVGYLGDLPPPPPSNGGASGNVLRMWGQSTKGSGSEDAAVWLKREEGGAPIGAVASRAILDL